jgi:hypothetical protein
MVWTRSDQTINMPSTDCRTRCVLLAPKGDRAQDCGDDVQSMLDRRGWIAHEADDTLGALAELCLLERTQSLRQAWGLQTVERLALVVVGPQQTPQLPAMVSAARRYGPKAALWSFVDGEMHPLDAPGSDQEPWRQDADAPPPAQDRTVEVMPPPITGDEIAMLLEGEDPEPPS